MNKIAVIIVLYYSDPPQFLQKKQNREITCVMIDNTPQRDLNLKADGCIYIPNNNNLGIAYAQNVGINWAIDNHYDFVVFFDQDSHFDSLYVNHIVDEYIRIESFIKNLYLLGPRVINERQDGEYKSLIHKDNSLEDFVYKREIISSGSCLRLSKLEAVGLLEEKLFIDLVDYEWCWRAEDNNYINGYTMRVKINHSIGIKLLKFWKLQLIISAPFRCFYQSRNYLILIKRGYVPRIWKLTFGLKLIISFFYSFFLSQGYKRIYFYIKGFISGIFKY